MGRFIGLPGGRSVVFNGEAALMDAKMPSITSYCLDGGRKGRQLLILLAINVYLSMAKQKSINVLNVYNAGQVWTNNTN